VDPNDDEFGELKDLAKRFAQSYGTDSFKNREAFAMIHKYVQKIWTSKN
jgi:hypothetical protein